MLIHCIKPEGKADIHYVAVKIRREKKKTSEDQAVKNKQEEAVFVGAIKCAPIYHRLFQGDMP